MRIQVAYRGQNYPSQAHCWMMAHHGLEAEAEAEVEAETEAEGYYLSALLILLAGPNAHWHSSSSLLGCPLQFYY